MMKQLIKRFFLGTNTNDVNIFDAKKEILYLREKQQKLINQIDALKLRLKYFENNLSKNDQQ